MPVVPVTQNSFGQGELGQYMVGRAELEVYQKSAKTLENFIVLPHGGLYRCPGFELVYDLGISDADAAKCKLVSYKFNASQQYIFAFVDNQILIFRDRAYKATLTSPYDIDDVRDIRVAHSGDTMIVVHEDYAPRKIERLGSDTNWTISEITFDNKPYFRYNVFQTLTASATTGSITLTLSGTEGYWNKDHISTVIKTNTGTATITGFVNDATGGTAYSGAGTASYAFDANASNICSAGVDGWIGYDFGANTTVKVVGIKSNTTATFTLVFESDDNSSFTSATEVYSETIALTAGTYSYIEVPYYTAEDHFRIRETGGADLDVQDMIFHKGLVVNATVGTTLSGTTADSAWTEEAWGTGNGYPRTVVFYQNRLGFGGTRSAPNLLLLSRTSDFFNFDDTSTDATYTIKAELSSDQNHIIRDMKSQVNLLVMTSDGVFEVSHTDTALSPTTILVNQQSNVGISTVPSIIVDGELFYNTVDGHQIRSFIYSFARNRYDADNKTVLAHHLFGAQKFPVAFAELRNFSNTQANFLIVVREDGEMAVLTIDSQKGVEGWWRRTTDGKFHGAEVAASVDANGQNIDTLYCVVERENGVYLEALTDQDVYLDHWYDGTSGTAKTNWTGLSTLEGEEVTVVGDGLVNGIYTVNSGEIDLSTAVEEIYVGLPYTSTLETHNLVVFLSSEIVRGRQVTKKRVIADVYNTKSMSVDGYAITSFRQKPGPLLDAELQAFTGQIEKRVKGNPRRDQTISITVTEPLPCIITSLTTEALLGD